MVYIVGVLVYGVEGRREAKGKIRVRKGEGGTGREVARVRWMRAAEVEGWGMEGGRDEKKGAMLGKREEGEKG